MQGFQLIMNFIVLPLFFLSSALFPVPVLPVAIRLAVRLNPLSYGVDGLRGARGRSRVAGTPRAPGCWLEPRSTRSVQSRPASAISPVQGSAGACVAAVAP